MIIIENNPVIGISSKIDNRFGSLVFRNPFCFAQQIASVCVGQRYPPAIDVCISRVCIFAKQKAILRDKLDSAARRKK